MASSCPRIPRRPGSRRVHDGRGDLCPASSARMRPQPSEVIHVDILQLFGPRREILRTYRTVPGLAQTFCRKSLSSSFVTRQSDQAMSAPGSGHSDYWFPWAHIFLRRGFYLKHPPEQGRWYRVAPNASPLSAVPIFRETLQDPPLCSGAYPHSFLHEEWPLLDIRLHSAHSRCTTPL